MARRLLLLRRAAPADRRASATELDHLRGRVTVTQVEHALDCADTAATVLRGFDVETDGVYAAGVLRASIRSGATNPTQAAPTYARSTQSRPTLSALSCPRPRQNSEESVIPAPGGHDDGAMSDLSTGPGGRVLFVIIAQSMVTTLAQTVSVAALTTVVADYFLAGPSRAAGPCIESGS